MTVAPDRAATVENAARDPASPIGETSQASSMSGRSRPPAFGLGPGTRPTAARERSREMEFRLMRLEGGAIMPDSIFGVLDNGNPGRLPLGGHWSEYSTVSEHDFKFAPPPNGRLQRGDISSSVRMRSKGGPSSSWRAWKEIQAVVTRRPAIVRRRSILSRRSNSRALNALSALRSRGGPSPGYGSRPPAGSRCSSADAGHRLSSQRNPGNDHDEPSR